MGDITKDDVQYVASLAHLAPNEATKGRLVKELGAILDHMAKLNELDTSQVEPTMHAVPRTNVFREDVAQTSLERDKALKNAPKTDGEYFLVPRILDTGGEV